VNSSGSKGYSGPCPPPGHGAHRYNFTVYALDVEKIETGQDISPAEVVRLIIKHSLAYGSITGLYERK